MFWVKNENDFLPGDLLHEWDIFYGHLFSLYLQRLFVRFGFFGRGTEAENVNLSVDSDEVRTKFIWASLYFGTYLIANSKGSDKFGSNLYRSYKSHTLILSTR